MVEILNAKGVSYQQSPAFKINDITFSLEKGKILSILGPNGSGKSTMLKLLSKLIKVDGGMIALNGRQLQVLSEKEIAKELGMLTQTQQQGIDLTVEELVNYGRQPHRKWYQPLSEEDKQIVNWALKVTHLEAFRGRLLQELSGGERQRAWIAMAITQMPKVLLLDEPTTYLDLKHQVEVMTLVKTLNKLYGMSIIMVLHDMNQAYQYSDEIMIMKNGQLYEFGKPNEIFNEQMFQEVFGIEVSIYENKGIKMFSPVMREEDEYECIFR